MKNYTHNAVIKVLRFLKKAMERAVEEELLMRVPFPKVVLRTQPTDRGGIDDTDLERLRLVELTNPKLLLVRDAFLFSCYTGLSYADISRLVRDNIVSMHGRSWVVLCRKKTGVLSTIHLMSVAVHILTPYLTQATSTECRIFPPMYKSVRQSTTQRNTKTKWREASTHLPLSSQHFCDACSD